MISPGHGRSNNLSSLNGYGPLANFWARPHQVWQPRTRQRHPAIRPRCACDAAFQEYGGATRREDLTANAAQTLPDISDFLGLDGREVSPSFAQNDGGSWQVDAGAPAAGLPLDRILVPLLAQVNDLYRNLGCPPVTAAGA